MGAFCTPLSKFKKGQEGAQVQGEEPQEQEATARENQQLMRRFGARLKGARHPQK